MTLIVEDGSLVANANTYASLNDVKAYALARGLILADDAQTTINIIKSMDFLEAKRKDYQGSKVDITQSLQFPRTALVIDDSDFPNNAIPQELKSALCQLVIELSNGVDLLPTITEAPVRMETVGPIVTEYAVNPGEARSPIMFSVDSLLAPLLKSSQFSGLRITRI